jgi:hypothetical protein
MKLLSSHEALVIWIFVMIFVRIFEDLGGTLLRLGEPWTLLNLGEPSAGGYRGNPPGRVTLPYL